MEYITVKELFKITKGKKVEEIDYENENSIRYIQIDDLRNNNNIKHCENINKYVIAKKEDIIIAWDGANAGTIGFGIEGAIGSTLAILRKENKEMDTEFCGLFLRSKSAYLREKCTGATIPHIQRTALEDIKIPKISLNKQIEIKNIINKAQELIDKRKEQIEALDELVKSKFIEMFGNIITNSKNWETVKLKDICLLKSGGTPTRSKPEYFQGDIPWITTVALGKNFINENDAIEYITQEAISNSATKLIKENSLLFGMRVGVGKTSINTVPMCTNQDIMAITEIDTTKYDLIFLKKIIESYSEYFNNQKRGATIQGIKSDTLKEIEIPIISSEAQNQFADFVKQVDKLKFEMEKSLKELEDNFNSLMQKAFKGELFN